MRIYIRQHRETLLDVVNLMISQLRKEPHLVGSEVAFLDLIEDFRNDMLGNRVAADKEDLIK